MTRHSPFPIGRKDVVDRNDLPINWLAINDSGRKILLLIRMNEKAKTPEINISTRIILAYLAFEGLMDNRQALLPIDYKPDLGITVVKRRQHISRLTNEVRGFSIHLPEEDGT